MALRGPSTSSRSQPGGASTSSSTNTTNVGAGRCDARVARGVQARRALALDVADAAPVRCRAPRSQRRASPRRDRRRRRAPRSARGRGPGRRATRAPRAGIRPGRGSARSRRLSGARAISSRPCRSGAPSTSFWSCRGRRRGGAASTASSTAVLQELGLHRRRLDGLPDRRALPARGTAHRRGRGRRHAPRAHEGAPPPPTARARLLEHPGDHAPAPPALGRHRRPFRRAGSLEPLGPGTGLIHAIERRALGRVRLLLPMGVEPSAEANALGLDKPTVALPVAIGVTWSTWECRATARPSLYGRDPEKKGLDLAVADLRGRGSGGVAPSGDRHRSGGGAPPLSPPRRSRAPRPRIDRRYSSRPVCRAPRLGGGVRVRIAPRGLRARSARGARRRPHVRDPALPRPLSRARARALASTRGSSRATSRHSRSRAPSRWRRPHRRRARPVRRARCELLRPHSHEELRRRVKEQVLPVLLGS